MCVEGGVELDDVVTGARRRATRRRLLSLAAGGGAAAAIAVAAGSTPPDVSAQATEPIVGSWLSVYHRSSGETITGLLTLHADGTFVSSASDHATRGPAHGLWTSLGNNVYGYSVLSINVDGGNFVGITALDGEITVDSTGTTWTSTSRVNYYDANGSLYRQTTSLASAQRIPLLRLDQPAPQMLFSPS
jgi:hypothetical protein